MFRVRYDYQENEVYGLGVDEKTSVLIKPNSFQVLGRGNAFLYYFNRVQIF